MSQQYPQDTPQYQHSSAPYQQPGGPLAPPPGYELKKKKTHKFRNFVVFPIAGLIALIVIISLSTGGSGGSGGGATNSTADDSHAGVPVDRNAPFAVTPGKAFQIPGTKHRIEAGWKLNYSEVVGSTLVGSVTNVSKDTSTAFFSVKFLKGNNVLGNFQCNTQELEPGQTEQVECYNAVTTTQRVTGWDKVTAEATL